MKVTGSPRATEFGSPVRPAFPESRYSRGQRSKILWAFGELFAPNPSALSSAHPLPQNSKQLIAPKLFLERLHSRKTEARNISKARPQLSAGAHLKSLRAENLLLPSKPLSATGFAQLRELQCPHHPQGFLPTWVWPRHLTKWRKSHSGTETSRPP